MTDEALVRAAQAGDRRAFDELMERHYDTAFAVAYARLRAREAAEDVVQEAFLRAWLRRDDLRDGAVFGGWLVRIVRNLAHNWNRPGNTAARLSHMLPLEDMESEPMAEQRHPLDGMIDAERQALLQQAIGGLTDEERELVLAHYLGNATQRELGERLGVNHSTVSRRLEKLMEKLRQKVGLLTRTPHASPLGKARAAKAVAAVAALTAAQQKTLAATAAASTPPAASSAFAPWLKSILTPLAEGLVVMSTGKKLAAAAVMGMLICGGVAVQHGYVGVGSAHAAPPAQRISKEITFATYGEQTLRIPLGESWQLHFTDHPQGLASIILTARHDGTLVGDQTLKDGSVHRFEWHVERAIESGQENKPSMQVLLEGDRLHVQSIDIRVVDNVMEVAYFCVNRPELLPLARDYHKRYQEGRMNLRQLQAAMLQLLEKNNMLPTDPANRARAIRAIKTSGNQ